MPLSFGKLALDRSLALLHPVFSPFHRPQRGPCCGAFNSGNLFCNVAKACGRGFIFLPSLPRSPTPFYQAPKVLFADRLFPLFPSSLTRNDQVSAPSPFPGLIQRPFYLRLMWLVPFPPLFFPFPRRHQATRASGTWLVLFFFPPRYATIFSDGTRVIASFPLFFFWEKKNEGTSSPSPSGTGLPPPFSPLFFFL